jgi:hypothetical protein
VVWPFTQFYPGADSFRDRFYALVEGFALFNPHSTIRLDWFGTKTTWRATDRNWQKWKPNKPTSPHWYELRHFERLIGAYITHDRERGTSDRLVSDLVREFDGLQGSGKVTKVLADSGLKRVKLSELVIGDRLDGDRIGRLLTAMQNHTRPVNPRLLGTVGEGHFRERLLDIGIKEESFHYAKKVSKEGLPWVLEVGFGWLASHDDQDSRKIYTGINWSAAIKNPFRSFGTTGEGLETALADARATSTEPIVYVLHLAQPGVEYTDRGKSALVIGGDA